MEDKIFLKWEKSKRSFLVIEDKALFAVIKSVFNNIKGNKERAGSKADAKKNRQTLEKRPEKFFEKSTRYANERSNKVLIQAMAEKKDEYYKPALYSNSSTKLNGPTLKQRIRRQIVEGLKKDGYAFIEEVNGKITVLSDGEAENWVGETYKQYRNSQHLFDVAKLKEGVKQSVKQEVRHFSSDEDELIKKCIESTKNGSDGFSFAMVPWNTLESQLHNRSLSTIMARARSLFDKNGVLILCDNDRKEWTYDEDRIVWDAKAGDQPTDFNVLSQKLGRKEQAIKRRMNQVAFDSSGKRTTISDVRHTILDDKEKAMAYRSNAEMKSDDELPERSLVMGCQEHRYKGDHPGVGYCQILTEAVGGIKGPGPYLHQAAATIGSGKRPADPKPIAGRKRRKYDASHRCKNTFCINTKHIKWELDDANNHRRTCVGMVKFNIGGKVIMRKARECTCDDHCLDFISAP